MKKKFVTSISKITADIQDMAGEVLQQNGGYFTVTVEPVKKPGSEEQNRTWHALIREFWRSGCSSYDNFYDMRDRLKLRIAGAKEYIWMDKHFVQHTAKQLDDIPPCDFVGGVPKSWTDFSKGERRQMIDDTITEMFEAGVNSKKFDEILEGMGYDRA